MTTLPQRTIGSRSVSAIGLGGMPMSIEGRPERSQAIATIHAALDAGITLIDTADSYHRDANEVGHNESLIAEALATYEGSTDDVLVATKGGHLRPGDGSWTQNGDPDYLLAAARASVERLGGPIDLYQFHRPDPAIPYADSIGALRTLLDEGLIRMAGISNASVAQIDEAVSILGDDLVSVQNQFSPAFLSSRGELEHCAELGLAFLPWSPLGGIHGAGSLGSNHTVFQELSDEIGISPYRVLLAWELSLAPVVIPIPGASRPASIEDSALATSDVLTDEQIARIEAAL